VLCSLPIDDLSQDTTWSDVSAELRYAADHQSVALLHAHVPGETVSYARITQVLEAASTLGLEFVTFHDLVPSRTPASGIALCFDDQAVDAWYSQASVFRDHGARVTFFVTRFANWTEVQKGKLSELAADGHDVQAHSVNHLNAVDYADTHGMAAYLDDEALPSIALLTAAGYDVTSYAFPFGASTQALNDAMLQHVNTVRVSPGSCPY
jgi:peptidoglycan/xylan/chitin deacetylase (PgdA/CDA1 family)